MDVDEGRPLDQDETPTPDTDSGSATRELQHGFLGRLLGDFRIVRKLGEGGMGVVYEAEQQHPKRPVALKVIRGGAFVDETQVKLFEREAQTLARLKHPSIAAIYEMGRTEDGQHFFAMELVRGDTLGTWLKQAGSDLRLRLGLFRKVCEAVAYAHQRGVIHRDLKPANILVLREPASASTASGLGIPDIKILDFGLARITDTDVAASTFLTDMGTVRGTLPYMSPEQIRGNPDEIDLRTDVYSLGVLLYEMLSGKLPHDLKHAQIAEAARIICEEPPAPVTKSWGGGKKLDADVATIAHKALEKEPQRRYQSVAALGEDVQRYLSDLPILARPPSAAYQFRKLVARHKVGFGFIGAIFVMVSALAITMTIQAARIAKERDRANREAQTAKSVSEFLVGLFQVSTPSQTRGETVTAREILDKGAGQIETRMAGQPAIQGRLFGVVGEVYRNLGMYKRSDELLRRAIDARTAAFGADSVEVAEAMSDLGFLYGMWGRYDEGRDLERRALAIAEARLAPDDVRLAKILYRISGLAGALSDFSTCERDLRRALPIFEKALGPDDVNVAWCLNDLALLETTRNNWQAANDLFTRALRIKERALPPGDPDIALTRNNIGLVLTNVGKFDEAEREILEALAETEKIYGANHPSTANILQSLGECRWKRGALLPALEVMTRALAIQQAALSADNSASGETLRLLACIERDLGRNEDAERHFRAALAIGERVLGRDHPDVARILEEYAKLARTLGRSADANAMDERARKIRRATGVNSNMSLGLIPTH